MFLECSTIDPATAKSISAKAKSLNALMVDAPVSGGIKTLIIRFT